MQDKVTDFPQYRKLSNDKVFYCIHSERHFDEIQRIGSKAQLHTIHAEQYPEVVRIQELLNAESEFILEIEPEEYARLLDEYALR